MAKIGPVGAFRAIKIPQKKNSEVKKLIELVRINFFEVSPPKDHQSRLNAYKGVKIPI